VGSKAGGVVVPELDESVDVDPFVGVPLLVDPFGDEPFVEVEDEDVPEVSAGELVDADGSDGAALPLSVPVELEPLGEVVEGVSVADDEEEPPSAGAVEESLAEGAAVLSAGADVSLPEVDPEPSAGLASSDLASSGLASLLAAASAGLSSGLASPDAASAGPSSGFVSSGLAASVVAPSVLASSGFASTAAAGASVVASAGLASVAAAGASVAAGAVSLVAAGVSALGSTAAAAGAPPVSLARSAAMMSSIFLNASSAHDRSSDFAFKLGDLRRQLLHLLRGRIARQLHGFELPNRIIAACHHPSGDPRHASETIANAVLLIPSNIRLYSSRASGRAPPATGLD
jgi:hypothetical protein